MMATVRRVRSLRYAWEVHSHPDDNRPATVITTCYEDREFYCCSCDAWHCVHAAAVLHHVIDRESE